SGAPVPGSTRSWGPSARLLARVGLAGAAACPVGGLELGVVRVQIASLVGGDGDALARLGVGEVGDAVLPHALGVREHVGELLLLVLLRGGWKQRLAGIVRRLELRVVRVQVAA